MEVEVVKADRDDFEIHVDNQTVVEVLRVYLNNRVDGVKFAAWRREHPTKPIIFKIQTSGKTVKKAVADAITAINKDCDNILKGIKKK